MPHTHPKAPENRSEDLQTGLITRPRPTLHRDIQPFHLRGCLKEQGVTKRRTTKKLTFTSSRPRCIITGNVFQPHTGDGDRRMEEAEMRKQQRHKQGVFLGLARYPNMWDQSDWVSASPDVGGEYAATPGVQTRAMLKRRAALKWKAERKFEATLNLGSTNALAMMRAFAGDQTAWTRHWHLGIPLMCTRGAIIEEIARRGVQVTRAQILAGEYPFQVYT